jgi:hypothetical protein
MLDLMASGGCPESRTETYLRGVSWRCDVFVFQMEDADHYRKLEDFPVQKKVHSMAVDTGPHRVYAPEQEADGKAVARMVVYEADVH